MKLVHGLTDSSDYKFFKSINNKKFFYNGDDDEGIFIEEILFNSLILLDPVLKDNPFQVFVKTDNEFYLSFFNDFDAINTGESTIVYSRDEFSDEDISNYLSELFIYDDNFIIFCEIDKDDWHFQRDSLNIIDKVINVNDINYEVISTGILKIKKMIFKNSPIFIIILLSIVTPFILSNVFEGYFLKKISAKNFQLIVDRNNLQLKQSELNDIVIKNAKAVSGDNETDILSDQKKLEEFLKKYG